MAETCGREGRRGEDGRDERAGPMSLLEVNAKVRAQGK